MMDQTEQKRPIPLWGWILATFFFPLGYFAILCREGLISKRLTWGLGLLTYGVQMIFVSAMTRLSKDSLQYQALLALMAIFMFGVGYWQYQIGKVANYWSPKATRRWRIVGVFAIILIVLNLTAVAAVMASPVSTTQ